MTATTTTRQVRCTRQWGACSVGELFTVEFNPNAHPSSTVLFNDLPFITATPTLTVGEALRGVCHKNFEFVA